MQHLGLCYQSCLLRGHALSVQVPQKNNICLVFYRPQVRKHLPGHVAGPAAGRGSQNRGRDRSKHSQMTSWILSQWFIYCFSSCCCCLLAQRFHCFHFQILPVSVLCEKTLKKTLNPFPFWHHHSKHNKQIFLPPEHMVDISMQWSERFLCYFQGKQKREHS